MFKSMHERIGMIAEEDSNRSSELGANCPSTLRVILTSGFELPPVNLSDGVNGHDKKTIDLLEAQHDVPGGGQIWIVAIAEIAALHQTYPTEAEIKSADSR